MSRRRREPPPVTTRQMPDEEWESRQERMYAKQLEEYRRPRMQDRLKSNKGVQKKWTHRTTSRSFAATTEEACPRCRDGIKVGDRVRYVNDVLMHVMHKTNAPAEESQPEICGTCWLSRPCEHDEED